MHTLAAIAVSQNSEKMAHAFSLGVEAGRIAFKSGLGIVGSHANPTSPLTGFLS